MKVYINYDDKRWRKYKIDFEKIANAAALNVSADAEVSITLTNDSEIHKINREYRNIDKPTNVLSFELIDSVTRFNLASFTAGNKTASKALNSNVSGSTLSFPLMSVTMSPLPLELIPILYP